MVFYIWTNCYTFFQIKDNVDSIECLEILKNLIKKNTKKKDEIYTKLINMLSDQTETNIEILKKTCDFKEFNVDTSKPIQLNIEEKLFGNNVDGYRLWLQTKDSHDNVETQFLLTKDKLELDLLEWRNSK